MLLSVRSTLSAGIAAGLVVAAGATAVSPAVERPLQSVSSQAFQLSAAIEPLLQPVVPAAASSTSTGPSVTANLGTGTAATGDWIITVYDYVQPWVQYGVNLVAWATSWLPWPIGLIGPQANVLYGGWQPIGQALAYAASFLLDGQFDLVIPTLVNGVKTGVGDLIRGEINWVLSFFPPLPPISFPIRPSAATVALRAATANPRSAATVDAPVAEAPATETSAAEKPAAETAPTRRAAAKAERKAARAALKAERQAARAARTAAAVTPKTRKAERVATKKAAAASSTRVARATR